MKRASVALVAAGLAASMGGMGHVASVVDELDWTAPTTRSMVDSGLWSTPSGHKRRRGLTAAAQKRLSVKRKNVLRHRRHVRGRK